MELDSRLLEILACPKCKGPLEYKEGEAFICNKCRLHYAIVDGIPNFLVEEARSVQGLSSEDGGRFSDPA